MPSSDADTLMYLAHSSGTIKAECQAVLDPDADALVKDFRKGFFFAVDDFSVGLDLIDSEGSDVDHGCWRTRQSEAAGTSESLQVKFDVLTFSRLIDAGSPRLLQHCLNLDRLDKAVLVKRHGVGARGPLGFLRLDMADVTILGVDWVDGEAVKESCSLSFQGLRMTYLPRKPSGAALPSLDCSWSLASQGELAR